MACCSRSHAAAYATAATRTCAAVGRWRGKRQRSMGRARPSLCPKVGAKSRPTFCCFWIYPQTPALRCPKPKAGVAGSDLVHVVYRAVLPRCPCVGGLISRYTCLKVLEEASFLWGGGREGRVRSFSKNMRSRRQGSSWDSRTKNNISRSTKWQRRLEIGTSACCHDLRRALRWSITIWLSLEEAPTNRWLKINTFRIVLSHRFLFSLCHPVV